MPREPSTIFLGLLLFAYCSSAEVHAQNPKTEDNTDSSSTTAATSGNVDLSRSFVYVRVGKTGLGHEHAVGGKLLSANIVLGKESDAGELQFDMRSFRADADAARTYLGFEGTTPAATRRQINESMLGNKILDVARFPKARFVIKSASPTPEDQTGNSYQLVGDFTLHGVTRPILVPVTIERQDTMIHLTGQFKFPQSQYGIRPFRKALGAIGVADEIEVRGDFWIRDE